MHKALGPPEHGYQKWFRSLTPSLQQKEQYRRWSYTRALKGQCIPILLIFAQHPIFTFEWECFCRLWPDTEAVDNIPGRIHHRADKLEGAELKCPHCSAIWMIHVWEWAPIKVLFPKNTKINTHDPRIAYCYMLGSVSKFNLLMGDGF